MSSIHTDVRSETSEPQRPLRSDFTKRVLRNAATAKRRDANKQRLSALSKELFSMKAIKFLRTVPGAIAAVAVLATGGMGVYALDNWFGGNVAVTQDGDSVFSVDLSSCHETLPPGIDTTSDLHKVQFKITGSPHISAQDLQRQLLGECEASAVAQFYQQKFPDAGFTPNNAASASSGQTVAKYGLFTGTVKSVSEGVATLSSTGSKGASFGAMSTDGHWSPIKQFALDPQVTVYDQSKPVNLHSLSPGDYVTFVVYAPSAPSVMVESKAITDYSDVRIMSIFKTQYDDGWSSFDYEGQNVMPLDMYNAIQQSASPAVQQSQK